MPPEPTREPIAEWVALRRSEERLAARVVCGRGDYRMTAKSTVAFGEVLLNLRERQPERTGVLPPEELFTLGELRAALEERGLEIVER